MRGKRTKTIRILDFAFKLSSNNLTALHQKVNDYKLVSVFASGNFRSKDEDGKTHLHIRRKENKASDEHDNAKEAYSKCNSGVRSPF